MSRDGGESPRTNVHTPATAPGSRTDEVTRDLTAGLAHDINNPLTWVFSGIAFALEAMEKGDLAQARNDLRQAREGAERVHAVVRRMEAWAASGNAEAARAGGAVGALQGASLPSGPRIVERGRVLVVDDEPSLVELVQQALAATFVVVACPSPRAALALVQGGERFDAVLCDLAMPELDGLSLYAELRRIAPALAARTVLMTGGPANARSQALLAAHPGPRLVKPFGMRALREVLREVAGLPPVA